VRSPEVLEAWERFVAAGFDVLDAIEEDEGTEKDPSLPEYPHELPSFDELVAELTAVRDGLREELDPSCA